jgi:hypothetical protein
MDADLIEQLSDKVHQGWEAEKIKQGFADHVIVSGCFPPYRDCHRCDLPTAKHHTDMLPYADLPEHVKEYDRATVRAVLGALDELGHRIVPASSENSETARV